MKNFRIKKSFYIALGFVLTVFGHIAFADNAFDNNLIKMDVSENTLGGVRVNLYTSKPYSDAVSVNKKSDSEYVILMPETSNSMISSPVVKSPEGVIKNVEVKTQQYGNKVKGYTKIIISTSKPVEIIPQVQNIGSKITEKDYNELLSQISKKTSTAKPAPVVAKKPAAKTELKQVQTTKKETPKVIQNPTQKPIIIAGKQKSTEQKPLKKVEIKPQAARMQQPIQKVTQKPVQKPVVAQKVQPKPQVTQKTQTKPAPTKTQPQVQVKLQEQPKVATTPQTVPTSQLVQTTQPTQQDNSRANVHVPTEENTPAVVKAPVAPVEPIAQVTPVVQQTPIQKFTHSIKNMLDHFVNNNSIYTVAGVALIPILALFLLIRIARKAASKFKSQKDEFMKNLQEKPQEATNYSEKIDENMSWREKFKAYTDMNKPSPEPEATSGPEPDIDSALPSSQELDELFGSESFMDEVPTETESQEEFFEQPEQVQAQEEIPAEFEESPVYAQEESINPIPAVPASSLDEFDVNMEGIDEEEISIDELFGEEEIYPESFEETIQEDVQESYTIYKEDEIFEEFQGLEEEKEDELIKSEFNIDDEKGFYLVDFEDTTTLVGHIADEIFVLKKFDKKINAPLQARVNEKKGNSTNYMTRVGNFKALVEVTPQNMNLLIEL